MDTSATFANRSASFAIITAVRACSARMTASCTLALANAASLTFKAALEASKAASAAFAASNFALVSSSAAVCLASASFDKSSNRACSTSSSVNGRGRGLPSDFPGHPSRIHFVFSFFSFFIFVSVSSFSFLSCATAVGVFFLRDDFGDDKTPLPFCLCVTSSGFGTLAYPQKYCHQFCFSYSTPGCSIAIPNSSYSGFATKAYPGGGWILPDFSFTFNSTTISGGGGGFLFILFSSSSLSEEEKHDDDSPEPYSLDVVFPSPSVLYSKGPSSSPSLVILH